MNQKDQEKGLVPGQGAFEKFKAKIKRLSIRRNSVFVDIMARIDRRKIDEVRHDLATQDQDEKN